MGERSLFVYNISTFIKMDRRKLRRIYDPFENVNLVRGVFTLCLQDRELGS